MVKSAFLKLFLEAKKKCLTSYEIKATFGCRIPKFPGLRAIFQSTFPIIHQWLFTTESSLSQLRVSGGFGTKVPHPTSFEIYDYNLYCLRKVVNRYGDLLYQFQRIFYFFNIFTSDAEVIFDGNIDISPLISKTSTLLFVCSFHCAVLLFSGSSNTFDFC